MNSIVRLESLLHDSNRVLRQHRTKSTYASGSMSISCTQPVNESGGWLRKSVSRDGQDVASWSECYEEKRDELLVLHVVTRTCAINLLANASGILRDQLSPQPDHPPITPPTCNDSDHLHPVMCHNQAQETRPAAPVHHFHFCVSLSISNSVCDPTMLLSNFKLWVTLERFTIVSSLAPPYHRSMEREEGVPISIPQAHPARCLRGQ